MSRKVTQALHGRFFSLLSSTAGPWSEDMALGAPKKARSKLASRQRLVGFEQRATSTAIKETCMPDISRRRFLRDASLGAAAVGAVALIGGPSAFGAATATSAAASPLSSGLFSDDRGATASATAGNEVMAHVVDRSSGTICVYSGTTKTMLQNRELTEALLKAVR
jgi:hypothetical protein